MKEEKRIIFELEIGGLGKKKNFENSSLVAVAEDCRQWTIDQNRY